MKKIIYSLLCFFLVGTTIAQQTPANKQTEDYSIEGATAHLGNGQIIENSLIMFSEGKIVFAGNANARIARRGTVINAKGKHVYPGFIAANSSLGLVEIDAVKASVDEDEIGINKLFTGKGYTEDEQGNVGPKEYLAMNKRFVDIKGLCIVDVDPK